MSRKICSGFRCCTSVKASPVRLQKTKISRTTSILGIVNSFQSVYLILLPSKTHGYWQSGGNGFQQTGHHPSTCSREHSGLSFQILQILDCRILGAVFLRLDKMLEFFHKLLINILQWNIRETIFLFHEFFKIADRSLIP